YCPVALNKAKLIVRLAVSAMFLAPLGMVLNAAQVITVMPASCPGLDFVSNIAIYDHTTGGYLGSFWHDGAGGPPRIGPNTSLSDVCAYFRDGGPYPNRSVSPFGGRLSKRQQCLIDGGYWTGAKCVQGPVHVQCPACTGPLPMKLDVIPIEFSEFT